MEINLDISDNQYVKLPTTQKVDLIYFNQKRILERQQQYIKISEQQLTMFQKIKRMQRMQWLGLTGIASFSLWIFFKLWNHVTYIATILPFLMYIPFIFIN
jgi:hypothetical protein